jgi:hypothetical protein
MATRFPDDAVDPLSSPQDPAPERPHQRGQPPASPAAVRGRRGSQWASFSRASFSKAVPNWSGPRWELRENKWKSPAQLIGFFLLGLICSLAHIVRYATLQGQEVGGSSEQERNIQYVPCLPS